MHTTQHETHHHKGERHDSADLNKDLAQFVIFAIKDTEYAVSIMDVLEIKQWEEPTHIPSQVPWVIGVINLRGVIIPVLDLRSAFGFEKSDSHTEKSVILVVTCKNVSFGLYADRVLDIISYDAGAIEPLREVNMGDHARFFKGLLLHENRLITLLSLDAFMDAAAEVQTK